MDVTRWPDKVMGRRRSNMRYIAILGIVCLGTLGMASGCSDGTEGSGGAGGASASSSSSGMESSSSSSSSSGGGGMGSSSSSSSSTSTSTSTSTSSSSSGAPLINGCDQGTAEDHLADAKVTINVGVNGFTYSPACIRVKKGTDVNFVGMFSSHPTVGGLAGPPGVPDSASPIKQTMSGSSVTFTMDTVGTYPFYCEYHTPSMAGAVFVE